MAQCLIIVSAVMLVTLQEYVVDGLHLRREMICGSVARRRDPLESAPAFLEISAQEQFAIGHDDAQDAALFEAAETLAQEYRPLILRAQMLEIMLDMQPLAGCVRERELAPAIRAQRHAGR